MTGPELGLKQHGRLVLPVRACGFLVHSSVLPKA